MRPIATSLAAAGAALALAGCAADRGMMAESAAAAASPASSQTRSCFWAQNVNGFSVVDDDTVNVRVGVNDIYQLDLLGPCPDIDWSMSLGLQSRGASTICSGLDATIIAPSAIGPMRCPVQSVRKLSAAEAAQYGR